MVTLMTRDSLFKKSKDFRGHTLGATPLLRSALLYEINIMTHEAIGSLESFICLIRKDPRTKRDTGEVTIKRVREYQRVPLRMLCLQS